MRSVIYRNFRDAVTGEGQEMLVEDGRIVAYAPHIDHPEAAIQDLAGKEVLPGIVDAHCHILPTGLQLGQLQLGGAASREEVLDLVRARHAADPDGWLLAFQYDQNRFADGGHITRRELDAIAASRPILLRHANGHAGVANSAALAAAGIAEDAANPAGGEFGRDDDGRLNGLVLEHALDLASAGIPMPTLDQMVEAIILAGDRMRELGIVCAADMMTGQFDLAQELEAYRIASERGCRVATRLYLQWSTVFGRRAGDPEEFRAQVDALNRAGGAGSRVAGIKIFSDGAIASGTAAIYGSYEGAEAGGPVVRRHGRAAHNAPVRPVSGQLIYRPERLRDMVRTAHDDGWSVAVHSIGDHATDVVMDAFAATGEAARHRIEHAMILSDAQISRMAKLGCALCFQPEFLLRFGHAYRRQLGDARANRLKRTRSVLDAGIPLAFSSDRPVVPGDPWDGIRTAVCREGFDPAERCTSVEAIRAYTETAAAICGDAGVFGALVPGATADFQVRDAGSEG